MSGISLRECARQLGVSDMAIRKGVKSGRLAECVGRDEKGKPVITDVEIARREWTENSGRRSRVEDRSHEETGAESSVITASTLLEAQRLTTIERARKLRMENDLKTGRLIESSKAAKEAFEAARITRESILNIPARVSAELAAETDAGRVYLRLDAALREALEGAADQLMATAHG